MTQPPSQSPIPTGSRSAAGRPGEPSGTDSGADRIRDLWGTRTPYRPGEPWPERVDQHYASGVAPEQVQHWVPSASLLHSNGDAMDIAVRDGRIVGVRGRAQDRVNHGRLDVKDLYAWQANHARDRARHAQPSTSRALSNCAPLATRAPCGSSAGRTP